MTDSDADSLRVNSDALIRAVKAGKVRAVTSLLESKTLADVDGRDGTGKTALMTAVGISKEDVRTHIVRCLLKKKAVVTCQDEQGMTALMHACAKLGRDDVVRLIVRNHRCEPNIQDLDGNNALIHAVYSGNSPAIRIIVNSSFTKSKLNVDLRNESGMTALFLAFKLQQSECCRVLINEGNANTGVIQDKQGLYRILNGESFVSPALQRRSISENRAAPLTHPKPHPLQFPDIHASANYNEDIYTNPSILLQKKKKKRRFKRRKQRHNIESDDGSLGPPKTLTPIVTRKTILPPSISGHSPVMRNETVRGSKRYTQRQPAETSTDYPSDFETDSNPMRSHPVLGPIGSNRMPAEDRARSTLLPAIPLGRSNLVSSSMQDDDRATTV